MKTSPEDKANRGEWTPAGYQLPEDASGNIIVTISDDDKYPQSLFDMLEEQWEEQYERRHELGLRW